MGLVQMQRSSNGCGPHLSGRTGLLVRGRVGAVLGLGGEAGQQGPSGRQAGLTGWGQHRAGRIRVGLEPQVQGTGEVGLGLEEGKAGIGHLGKPNRACIGTAGWAGGGAQPGESVAEHGAPTEGAAGQPTDGRTSMGSGRGAVGSTLGPRSQPVCHMWRRCRTRMLSEPEGVAGQMGQLCSG